MIAAQGLQCQPDFLKLLCTMWTGPTQQQATADASAVGRQAVPRWGRPLAVATAATFCVSTAFPVVAGLSKNTGAFPKWWGIADVVLAFVLVVMVVAVMAATRGKTSQQADNATYRAYRVLIHGIFVMMLVFFLAGERVVWSNCLTGFSWRAWLLLYALPSWFTVVKAPPARQQT